MKRYERQIILPEIGDSGQQLLAQARVLIIGIGGLGCSVLQNLVGAGVGTIGIVDGDVVEETNLHRQFLYSPNDCGRNKVEVAAEVVSKHNPAVKISSHSKYLSKQNCLEIASEYQIIVDCTDNISARYLISDVAITKGIPMVYASIHKFEGQLSVFNYQNGPTYRCLFPEKESLKTISNCNDSGVLGVLPYALGAMQANEVLKMILGFGNVLSGYILLYNGLDNSFQTVEIQKNTNLIHDNKFQCKSISETEFFTNDEALIIDIREEYEEPKLEMLYVKKIPLSKLDDFLKETNPNQKIFLVCQNGNRSALAVDYLIKKGFTQVFHLENGVEALSKTNANDHR